MPITGRTATAAAPRIGWRTGSDCRDNRRMRMKRLGFLFGILFSGIVCAQSFPTRRVAFVSGVTPGSASDTMARMLAEKLQQQWGQPVIVEHKLGAGGLVGPKSGAQADPD